MLRKRVGFKLPTRKVNHFMAYQNRELMTFCFEADRHVPTPHEFDLSRILNQT